MAGKRDESKIETDITVFGATGYVGKQVCEYLVEASDNLPRSLKLTLGGRSRSKLEAVRDSLPKSSNVKVDVFVADARDSEGLMGMATRTRVVLSCAGPFVEYSSLVVAACAKTGADYVDITGEVEWAGNMRIRYGPDAQKSGARIISFCGFDSVPTDISVFLAAKALKDKTPGGKVELLRGTSWHSCFGVMNGGTLLTAVDMPLDLKYCLLYDHHSGKEGFRPVPFLMNDPFHLAHPTNVRFHPEYEHWKNKAVTAEWINQLPSFDASIGFGASIPFLMAVVNAKVVYSSATALNYGSNFTFSERFVPWGFTITRTLGIFTLLPALLTQLSLLAGTVIFRFPWLGKKLAMWLLPPGTGSPPELNKQGFVHVYSEVECSSDSGGSGHVDRATCFLRIQGDPGNLATAQCVGESALSLVFHRDSLPPRSEDGFGSPAQLLGPVLSQRLLDNQVRRVDVDVKVFKGVRRYLVESFLSGVIASGFLLLVAFSAVRFASRSFAT